jgi:hypothetical protein
MGFLIVLKVKKKIVIKKTTIMQENFSSTLHNLTANLIPCNIEMIIDIRRPS